MAFRKECKADGVKLSVNDFIIKAVGTALGLCPGVNVIWQGEEVCFLMFFWNVHYLITKM